MALSLKARKAVGLQVPGMQAYRASLYHLELYQLPVANNYSWRFRFAARKYSTTESSQKALVQSSRWPTVRFSSIPR